MKEKHPSFVLPENLDSKVWRYMDFTKYVSLLSTSSLFFVRADKFEDKFEGAATKTEKQWREDMKVEHGISDALMEMQFLVNKNQRKSVGICSWQLSEYESAAMWKLFLKSGDGVAIQTTFRKLADSFDNHIDESIYTGLVTYTDYDTEIISTNNLYNKFMHKRKSFDFEKEVRSVFYKYFKSEEGKGLTVTKENVNEFFEQIKGNGKYVKVDINTLIDNVIVSPNSDEWFFNLVKEVSAKFEFDFPIKMSQLNDVPYY